MKCLKDKLSFSCISPAVGCRGELVLSAACCVIYNDFVKWNPIMLHFCKEDMFYPAVLLAAINAISGSSKDNM